MLIDTHSCGTLSPGNPKRGTVSGTYTPATTGLYTFTIYNYRNSTCQDIQNYVDNICVVPQVTDFSADRIQVSASTAQELVRFNLDAGPTWGGTKYLVLLSFNNYPGINNNGNWIPLMMDGALTFSKNNANSNMLRQTNGFLDANGQRQAGLYFPNAMGSGWVGKKLCVAYILYQGSGYVPVAYASMPVTLYFVP